MCTAIVFPREDTLAKTSDMKGKRDEKLWWKYIEAAHVRSLDYSPGQRREHTISYFMNRLLRQLEPSLFCPHVHYDLVKETNVGKSRTLCGRLTLALNNGRNSDTLLSVHEIYVPSAFYLNISFLGFHSAAGLGYPVCGQSDIVLQGTDRVQFKLCGKPYKQSILMEGGALGVLSYHNYSVNSNSPSLIMQLEYQVRSSYPSIDVSSLHVILQSGILDTDTRIFFSRPDVVHVQMLEECSSRYSDVQKLSRQTLNDLFFSDMNKMHGITTLQGLSNLSLTKGLTFVQASDSRVYCEALNKYGKWNPGSSPISQLYRRTNIPTSRELLASSWDFLKVIPRQLLNIQSQILSLTVWHSFGIDGQMETIRIWSINSLPFNNSGDLAMVALSIYMTQQNCNGRHSDSLVVYDGPYAGILTPSGLISPFRMIAKKTCTDLSPGVVFNSSIGDISVLWSNLFGRNATISFFFLAFPASCPSQFCHIATFPVRQDQPKLIKLSTSHKPSFQIMKFSSQDNSRVRLKVVTEHVSFSNFVAECLVSGVFLVIRKLIASLCSDKSFNVFNLTMDKNGIQFGPEVALVVKTYPTNELAFVVEYTGTACYGLFNMCLNLYNPTDIYKDTCIPRVDGHLGGTMCVPSPKVTLRYYVAHSCCLEVTDMASDLMACQLPSDKWRRSPCSYSISHPNYSLFKVNVTAVASPVTKRCCEATATFSDHVMATQEPLDLSGQLCAAPLTVNTNYIHVRFPRFAHTIRDTIPCSIQTKARTFTRRLNEICGLFRIDDAYANAIQPTNSVLELRLEPIARCGFVTIRAARAISLTIQQQYLFDDKDKHTITKYAISFSVGTFNDPIRIQLDWSPVHLEAFNGKPDCGWHIEMLVTNDTRLHLADSVEGWLDKGININLVTLGLQNEVNISYTRRMKRHLLMAIRTLFAERAQASYCYLKKCYTGLDNTFENASWSDALNRCEAAGHQLLAVNSENEWLLMAEFLFEKVKCTTLPIIFIGLSNPDVSKV